jgi:hypothetical protein
VKVPPMSMPMRRVLAGWLDFICYSSMQGNYSVTLEGGCSKKWCNHFFEHPRYPWAESLRCRLL